MLPEARKDNLHVLQIENEVVIYDTVRSVAHNLSPAMAAVWRSCDGQSTIDDVCESLRRQGLPADPELVWLMVHRLSRLNLLTHAVRVPSGAVLSSRRELAAKMLALGGLFLFLGNSVFAPPPVQASSCTGTVCCW